MDNGNYIKGVDPYHSGSEGKSTSTFIFSKDMEKRKKGTIVIEFQSVPPTTKKLQ